MIYIMRRTQLYLDDDLWNTLHLCARQQNTTISDLVRQAARERYLGNADQRRRALLGIAGLWKNRAGLPDTETYVRALRRGARRQRLGLD